MILQKKSTVNMILLTALIVIFATFFSASAAAEVVYQTDFEDGAGNWQPRGEGVELEVVDSTAVSGSQSLLIKGRSQNWNGPSLNIDEFVEGNKEYNFSMMVKLVEGSENSTIIFCT
jgi:endo-1,4-beta-xylanase